jgi:hypothetical protein
VHSPCFLRTWLNLARDEAYWPLAHQSPASAEVTGYQHAEGSSTPVSAAAAVVRRDATTRPDYHNSTLYCMIAY